MKQPSVIKVCTKINRKGEKSFDFSGESSRMRLVFIQGIRLRAQQIMKEQIAKRRILCEFGTH